MQGVLTKRKALGYLRKLKVVRYYRPISFFYKSTHSTRQAPPLVADPNTERIPFQDVTFIIPLYVTHVDFLNNAKITLAYLLKHLKTNIIILEHGPRSHRKEFGIPETPEFRYFFQQSNDTTFHKTRLINEMMQHVNTENVVIYDIDVLLPIASYIKARELIIRNNYDVVQPFSNPPGVFYIHQKNKGELIKALNFNTIHSLPVVREGLAHGYPDILMNAKAGYGFAVFFKTEVFIKGGMENQYFVSYGHEDAELIYRFITLGFKVGNIEGPVYHLEHVRSRNSSKNNPHYSSNKKLWNYIQKLSKEELGEYCDALKH